MLDAINQLVDNFFFFYIVILGFVFFFYLTSSKHAKEPHIPPLPTPGNFEEKSENEQPLNGVWKLQRNINMEAMLEAQGVNFLKRKVMVNVCRPILVVSFHNLL